MQHAETLVADRRPWRRSEVARVGATAVTVAITLAAALTGATLQLTSGTYGEPGTSADGTPDGAAALPASPPVSVRIPAIDLETSRVVGLGRAPSGAIEVPPAAATVGWLRTGVTPGEAGAAVFVGHRGLGYARGAFHAAGELRAGDTVTVTRADGESVTFAVYDVTRSTGVPAAIEQAAAPTGRPELRLITWEPHEPGERAKARSVAVLAAVSGAAEEQPVTTGP